jgi:hypothetical protein
VTAPGPPECGVGRTTKAHPDPQLRDTMAGKTTSAATVDDTTATLRSVLRAAWLHVAV